MARLAGAARRGPCPRPRARRGRSPGALGGGACAVLPRSPSATASGDPSAVARGSALSAPDDRDRRPQARRLRHRHLPARPAGGARPARHRVALPAARAGRGPGAPPRPARELHLDRGERARLLAARAVVDRAAPRPPPPRPLPQSALRPADAHPGAGGGHDPRPDPPALPRVPAAPAGACPTRASCCGGRSAAPTGSSPSRRRRRPISSSTSASTGDASTSSGTASTTPSGAGSSAPELDARARRARPRPRLLPLSRQSETAQEPRAGRPRLRPPAATTGGRRLVIAGVRDGGADEAAAAPVGARARPGRAPGRPRPPRPRPACRRSSRAPWRWSSPPSTRASACRSPRRWPPGRRSSPRRRRPWWRSPAAPPSSSTRSTSAPSPARMARLAGDPERRRELAAAGLDARRSLPLGGDRRRDARGLPPGDRRRRRRRRPARSAASRRRAEGAA